MKIDIVQNISIRVLKTISNVFSPVTATREYLCHIMYYAHARSVAIFAFGRKKSKWKHHSNGGGLRNNDD